MTDFSYEAVMARMLARVPATVDKREGSVLWNALAPAAAEVVLMATELETYYDETYADTASRESLIKRCKDRGITPNPATPATIQASFNTALTIGDRFTAGAYTFKVTLSLGSNNYQLEAETAGSGPNTVTGSLVPIGYIDGLTTATITALVIPGEDEEETEALRARYFASFEAQAFGGNRADYKEKAKKLAGVGGAKAVRTPGGGGTVGLTIIASDFTVPTTTLINTVKAAIDPVGTSGEGDGLAPVGHSVTVAGVTETTINIASTITYASGWSWATLQPYATAMIDAYFLELKHAWESSTNLIVRVSQIEARYLTLPGVVDITGTTLNGSTANVALGVNAIPKRGTVSG